MDILTLPFGKNFCEKIGSSPVSVVSFSSITSTHFGICLNCPLGVSFPQMPVGGSLISEGSLFSWKNSETGCALFESIMAVGEFVVAGRLRTFSAVDLNFFADLTGLDGF